MKWVALLVATIVAGAVAAFAVYTIGWRDETADSGAAQSARARLAVEMLANHIDTDTAGKRWMHVAGSIWLATIGDECFLIDVDEFDLPSSRVPPGVADISCPD